MAHLPPPLPPLNGGRAAGQPMGQELTSEGIRYVASRSKDKGTAAETAVVGYLRDHGWPHVERRALNGAQDRGDLAGIVGVTVEIKNCARMELAAWVDELLAEQANDRSDVGVVVHKRKGKGDPAAWYATMTVAQLVALLHAAGYGTPPAGQPATTTRRTR